MRQRVDFHEKNLTSKALPLCTASRNLGKLGKEIFRKLETYADCGRKNTKACLVPECPQGPTLAEQRPEICPCLRRSASHMRPRSPRSKKGRRRPRRPFCPLPPHFPPRPPLGYPTYVRPAATLLPTSPHPRHPLGRHAWPGLAVAPGARVDPTPPPTPQPADQAPASLQLRRPKASRPSSASSSQGSPPGPQHPLPPTSRAGGPAPLPAGPHPSRLHPSPRPSAQPP